MMNNKEERIISLSEEEYRALRDVIWMAEAHIDEWKLDVMRQRAKVKIVRRIRKKYREAKVK